MENFTAINFHLTRDFSQKISTTFEFVRQNFKPLSASILLIAGPPVLVACMMMGSFFSDILTASFNAGTNPELMQELFMTTNFWIQMGLAVVFLMVSSVATVATVYNYLLLYEAKKTNKIAVREVWEGVRSTFWMYFGTFFLLVIAVLIMYIAFIMLIALLASASPLAAIPAGMALGVLFFYARVSLSLVFILRAYERIGFFQALVRSFQLIQGKWWSTFGLLFVLYLVAVFISYIFAIPGYAIFFITALHDADPARFDKPSDGIGTTMMAFFTLYYVAQMLLYSLPYVGIALQYFNLVERKEARGLMSQIDSIGKAPADHAAQDEHY